MELRFEHWTKLISLMYARHKDNTERRNDRFLREQMSNLSADLGATCGRPGSYVGVTWGGGDLGAN
jgi:hypothetical protein